MAKKNAKGQPGDLLSLDITQLVGEVRQPQPAEGEGGKEAAKPAKKQAQTVPGLWQSFTDSIEYYRQNPFKGTSVWVDDDIMSSLQKMKGGPLKANVKQLVNAMLRAFIMAELENCKNAKEESSKGLF